MCVCILPLHSALSSSQASVGALLLVPQGSASFMKIQAQIWFLKFWPSPVLVCNYHSGTKWILSLINAGSGFSRVVYLFVFLQPISTESTNIHQRAPIFTREHQYPPEIPISAREQSQMWWIVWDWHACRKQITLLYQGCDQEMNDRCSHSSWQHTAQHTYIVLMILHETDTHKQMIITVQPFCLLREGAPCFNNTSQQK